MEVLDWIISEEIVSLLYLFENVTFHVIFQNLPSLTEKMRKDFGFEARNDFRNINDDMWKRAIVGMTNKQRY